MKPEDLEYSFKVNHVTYTIEVGELEFDEPMYYNVYIDLVEDAEVNYVGSLNTYPEVLKFIEAVKMLDVLRI